MADIDWSEVPVTGEHAAMLEAKAVTPEIVGALGVRSITTLADLPPEFAWAGERAVPALAFPWRTPGGETVVQLRPDVPVLVEGEKDARKYLWPKDSGSTIGVVRDQPDGPVLFVEGTKQGLAAGAYAEGHAVYSIAGCRSWSAEGVPVADLDVVDGRDALLLFDADLETNPDVWEAADKFTRALKAEGARTVRYVLLPAGKTAGLDDVLGSKPADRRAAFLGRLIDQAVTKLPKRPAKKKASAPVPVADALRPMIAVNDDQLTIIDGITAALRRRWDGSTLFDFGGAISWRDGSTLKPVTKDTFFDLVAQASTTVAVTSKGEVQYAPPPGGAMGAALGRAGHYTRLERIASIPFVREDGTICQTEGYDEQTRAFLVSTLPGIEVPEDPSDEDVRAAVKFLTVEWLGDLLDSMPEEADRANCLALVLTPFVRGLVPLVPMAVINGLQMGVGKNLLSDVISMVVFGRPADPLPFNDSDEENRKFVTAAFREGTELFMFDEAHDIKGKAFARVITAPIYRDRILGVSNTVTFPNNATWLAMGNNVQISGDMARRVYVIRLAPKVANPQDRSVDSFRHPDLKGWTLEHRAELIQAGLTLIRSWFAAGRPQNAAGRRFASFEPWGGMVGGILDHAGVPGFLGNLQKWRSESDHDRGYWIAHLRWLDRHFPGQTFTAAEVVKLMQRAADVEHPPGRELADHTVAGYVRALGRAYSGQRDKVLEGLKLVRVAQDTSHGNQWAVDREGGTESAGPNTVNGGVPAGSGEVADPVFPDSSGPEAHVLTWPFANAQVNTCAEDETDTHVLTCENTESAPMNTENMGVAGGTPSGTPNASTTPLTPSDLGEQAKMGVRGVVGVPHQLRDEIFFPLMSRDITHDVCVSAEGAIVNPHYPPNPQIEANAQVNTCAEGPGDGGGTPGGTPTLTVFDDAQSVFAQVNTCAGPESLSDPTDTETHVLTSTFANAQVNTCDLEPYSAPAVWGTAPLVPPITPFLPLAVAPAVPECPDCDRPQALVPPALFWWACRHCHPATFLRP